MVSGELEMEFWLLSSHSGGPLRLRWIEQPLKRQAWALYVVLKSMLIIIINLIFVFLKGLIIFTIMNGACHPTLLRRVRKPKLGLWFFWSKDFHLIVSFVYLECLFICFPSAFSCAFCVLFLYSVCSFVGLFSLFSKIFFFWLFLWFIRIY